MKEKVIFDTNTIRNPEINKFLGNRKELELFVQDADIIIPLTVVEEIKRQKRTKLKSNKDSFISNPFHRLREINEEETKAFDIDVYIEKLFDEETISFEIIDIKNNDVLPLIKELAISKQPPFEPKDDTDKGFKDALIYFSVLEYLQEIPAKYVFLCAKDNRLEEAFKDNPNVIVVKDYEEFKQYSVSQFFDEYFIQKLKDELGNSSIELISVLRGQMLKDAHKVTQHFGYKKRLSRVHQFLPVPRQSGYFGTAKYVDQKLGAL